MSSNRERPEVLVLKKYMKHYIPYEAGERLDQLNRWFNAIICSKDYSDDDQWLAIRLNLLKWHELGYSYKQMQLSEIDDFSLSTHSPALLIKCF
jgi:hypothetical protein